MTVPGTPRGGERLALCALHHALFDLGVLGLTAERRIRVSDLYAARSEAGRGWASGRAAH